MPQIAVKDANGVTQSLEEPLAPGRAAAALSRPVVLSNEDNATIGALTETAPASDTASSGLNGRLQRIAQRLTSLIALLPASLGTKTAANSLPVTLASDGSLSVAAGSTSDAAWSSGNGTLVGLLKAIAANAISTGPSPVELGPFSCLYLTSGTNAAVQTSAAAAGDYLQHITLQPTSTSPGAFTLYDGSTSGANTVKYTHPGGASSLSNLAPLVLGFTSNCVNAGWHITIVSGWTVTLVGKFS